MSELVIIDYDDTQAERVYRQRTPGSAYNYPCHLEWKPKKGGGFEIEAHWCNRCQYLIENCNYNSLLGFKRLLKEFFYV